MDTQALKRLVVSITEIQDLAEKQVKSAEELQKSDSEST
jgi:hypothetical protein